MKIIKLTDREGNVCCVNFYKVEQVINYAYKEENYSKIYFNQGWIGVKETPEEIYDKLYPIILNM